MLLLFLMLVAAGNLCVGFVAAMQLGWGPKSFRDIDLARILQALREPAPAESPPPREEPCQENESASPPSSDDVLNEPTAEPQPEPAAAPVSDIDEADFFIPASPPPAALAEEPPPLAASLAQLAQRFDRFEAELADWDSRLRSAEVDADEQANLAIELLGLTTTYLERFEASLEPLEKLAVDEDATAAHRQLQEAVRNLSHQLGGICADLSGLHVAADTPQEQRPAEAVRDILAALYHARTQMEEPLARLIALTCEGQSLDSIVAAQALSGLLGRFCFERQWRTCIGHSAGRDSAGLLDVDGLQRLNATYGPLLARRALQAVGEIAQTLAPPGSVVVRIAGQQFAICLTGEAPVAAETIEQMRQQIEKTRFDNAGESLPLTVSAAVVTAKPGETSAEMLDRLRVTIREAKSYGRNRTFLWHEQSPTPVAPPDLTVADKTVVL